MKVLVHQAYEACKSRCQTVTELHNLLNVIEGGLHFVDVIQEIFVDEDGIILGSNYEIVRAVCNLILGKPLKLKNNLEFDFSEKIKPLYSDEMYATVRYATTNGFDMAQFYLNLRLPESELYTQFKTLNVTLNVFSYSHNYSDWVSFCVEYYLGSKESINEI